MLREEGDFRPEAAANCPAVRVGGDQVRRKEPLARGKGPLRDYPGIHGGLAAAVRLAVRSGALP